jgi:DNA repair protein RadC
MSTENIHENHRDRLREMYLKGGFKSMAPHQILELMLFYAIPRKDTNPLAHKLIDTFGSLSGVLEADPQALMAVDGVGKSVAAYLKMVIDVFQIYETEKNKDFHQLYTTDDFGRYLKPYFIGARNEISYLICLDGNMTLIACVELSQGDISSTSFSHRKIAEIAFRVNASYVVLAHNHPGATAIPSTSDIMLTQESQKILKELNVFLIDHLVFSDGDFTSMASSGYIKSFIYGRNR